MRTRYNYIFEFKTDCNNKPIFHNYLFKHGKLQLHVSTFGH